MNLIKSLSVIVVSTLISVPSFAYLIASPSFVNFGYVKKGSYTGTRTVTIYNQSEETVQVYMGGGCTMDFSVSGGCYGQLQPRASCYFNVSYSPYNTGSHSCTLSVTSDKSDYTSISISGSTHD